MSNQTKLEFRLVPTKGVASGKGCIIRGSNLTLPENGFSGESARRRPHGTRRHSARVTTCLQTA